MKKNHLLNYLSLLFLLPIIIVSFCKEDVYGNIKLSITIGNYLNIFHFDNLKTIIYSLFISFLACTTMIILLYPLSKRTVLFKRRKQNLILFFIILPMAINGLFKTYLLKSISISFLRTYLSIIFVLLPFIFLGLFFLLKDINFGQLDASKDLGYSYFKSFIKIIWPIIKNKALFWFSFVLIIGANLIIIDNDSLYLGNIIYNQVVNHMHVPYLCAIISFEYLLFYALNRRVRK